MSQKRQKTPSQTSVPPFGRTPRSLFGARGIQDVEAEEQEELPLRSFEPRTDYTRRSRAALPPPVPIYSPHDDSVATAPCNQSRKRKLTDRAPEPTHETNERALKYRRLNEGGAERTKEPTSTPATTPRRTQRSPRQKRPTRKKKISLENALLNGRLPEIDSAVVLVGNSRTVELLNRILKACYGYSLPTLLGKVHLVDFHKKHRTQLRFGFRHPAIRKELIHVHYDHDRNDQGPNLPPGKRFLFHVTLSVLDAGRLTSSEGPSHADSPILISTVQLDPNDPALKSLPNHLSFCSEKPRSYFLTSPELEQNTEEGGLVDLFWTEFRMDEFMPLPQRLFYLDVHVEVSEVFGYAGEMRLISMSDARILFKKANQKEQAHEYTEENRVRVPVTCSTFDPSVRSIIPSPLQPTMFDAPLPAVPSSLPPAAPMDTFPDSVSQLPQPAPTVFGFPSLLPDDELLLSLMDEYSLMDQPVAGTTLPPPPPPPPTLETVFLGPQHVVASVGEEEEEWFLGSGCPFPECPYCILLSDLF